MVCDGGSDGVGRSKSGDEIGIGTSMNESLGVRELPESLETVVTSPGIILQISDGTRGEKGRRDEHSTVADSSESETGKSSLESARVDGRSSTLGVLNDEVNLVALSKDVQREGSFVVVDVLDGLLERRVRNDGEDGTKDLFA